MGIDTMAKGLVTVRIENLEDLHLANRGKLPADEVRRVIVEDALVDTGATGSATPRTLAGTS